MFVVGDVVRLKNGTKPIKVTWASHYALEGYYLQSGTPSPIKDQRLFTLYENETKQKTKENDMNTLYEVEGKFATRLATNSSGLWVLEEKGTGVVFTADPAKCEEVVPYTVDIKFFGGNQTYSYTSKEGKFSVNDILFMPDAGYGQNFAQVVKVGSKSKAATKELKPIGRLVVDKLED